jgi:hypothetical protein
MLRSGRHRRIHFSFLSVLALVRAGTNRAAHAEAAARAPVRVAAGRRAVRADRHRAARSRALGRRRRAAAGCWGSPAPVPVPAHPQPAPGLCQPAPQPGAAPAAPGSCAADAGRRPALRSVKLQVQHESCSLSSLLREMVGTRDATRRLLRACVRGKAGRWVVVDESQARKRGGRDGGQGARGPGGRRALYGTAAPEGKPSSTGTATLPTNRGRPRGFDENPDPTTPEARPGHSLKRRYDGCYRPFSRLLPNRGHGLARLA